MGKLEKEESVEIRKNHEIEEAKSILEDEMRKKEKELFLSR